MMRIPVLFSAVVLCLFVCATTSQGDTVLIANMTNAGEPGGVTPTLTTGAPRPASFGTAIFILNTAETEMRMFAEVHNIDFTGSQTADKNDNLTAAHIHADPNTPPNPTAGVKWGFYGLPFNDNNPNDHVFTPFATGVGGTILGKWDVNEGNPAGTTLTSQLSNIKTGHAYANFHTVQFGGGEIRGTLVVVPEPGTILIAALASALLVGFIRRRDLH